MSERITKKQRELLDFIEAFNNENGFSPSYREIMDARNYKSVSTVAVHINNLIKLGFLRKIDNHARTLEVVSTGSSTAAPVSERDHLVWLRQKIIEYEKDAVKAEETETLKAALALLDQTDET
jgi:repressor LexA